MIRRIAAVLSLALFAACSSSEDGGGAPAVAVFVDTNYVDFDDTATPPDSGSEASNVVLAFQGAGFATSTFTGLTEAELRAAFAGRTALAIPEQENDYVDDGLDEAARLALYEYVNGGGNLILFYTDDTVTSVVNSTFGFALEATYSGAVEPIALQATDAAGTPYAGGAATLPSANATTSLVAASLPIYAKTIYADANGDAVVVVIPFGQGNIALLGYDWYDGAPNGTQDGGWLDVLIASAAQ